MKLWKLLLAFLYLGIEGEGDDKPNGDAAGAGDDTTGDDDLDLGGDDDAAGSADAGAAGDDEGKKEGKSEAETAAERRARLAEEALADERAQRRAEQQRTATPPKDTDYEREEATLAQARADPNTTQESVRWLQWQIDANRNMRANTRTSQAALAESRDIADKTEFGRLEITKPAVYKRYAERVEKAVQDMRANGQTASRSVILKLMIGDDIMSGKVKPKAPKAKTAEGTVDRGRVPGVRSDVSGRQRMNDRDKLRSRLKDQLI
jgi:hypothetical protein